MDNLWINELLLHIKWTAVYYVARGAHFPKTFPETVGSRYGAIEGQVEYLLPRAAIAPLAAPTGRYGPCAEFATLARLRSQDARRHPPAPWPASSGPG